MYTIFLMNLLFFSLLPSIQAADNNSLTLSPLQNDQYTTEIRIPVNLDDFIDQESLTICSDHPNVIIDDWQFQDKPIIHQDSTFKESKKVFNRPITIKINCTITKEINDASFQISYYLHSSQSIEEIILPIKINFFHKNNRSDLALEIDTDSSIELIEKNLPKDDAYQQVTSESFAHRIQSMVQNTDNIWLRIILVLLLGFLMSLTPCLYPMIPVTIGILQSQSKPSLWHNFLLALSYTLGIATTFASLGLLAATTGQLFGALMSHPLVIGIIILLLLYLAFSMLGFYEMYTPRFMMHSGTLKENRSFFSIFLFGMMSGSVASPCLSPGLILLLTIVTALKNKLIGFILLFSFGIGLSLPLLVVGTFSSALNSLPRAGMWMVKVKQLFGLILIGMCFYFLNTISPWHITITLLCITFLLFALFYTYKTVQGSNKRFHSIMSMLCIIIFVFSTALSYKAWYQNIFSKPAVDNSYWLTDYTQAQQKAIQENKPLIIKVGGPSCSICTAIDNKQFANHEVINVLKEKYICLKVNGAETTQDTANLKETFTLHGFPTILIINAQNKQTLARWGNDLFEVQPYVFFEKLISIKNNF